jgi:hypothetical protein
MRRVSFLLLLSFILIALLILAPIVSHFGGDLIYPARSNFSDLTITHWPAFAYLRDQLAATGQLPMWRTSMFSGTPFASNPLSGWFYPLHWIILIPNLPLSLAFNGLMLFHLSLAAGAMYVMMRSWAVSRAASMAAAIAYAASPKIIAHMGVGHVTLVEAWAWLPLVIVAVSKNKFVLAGLALALCLLADVRMAIYSAALAVTYIIIRDARRDRPAWAKLIGRIVIVLIVALTVSAVAWLPVFSMTGGLSRSALTPEEAGVQSLDPIYLLGVIIADRSGAAERTTYAGLGVLILAFIGVVRRRWSSQILWLAGGVIVGAIVALGTNTPVYQLLYQLPGSTLLRVPARAWFVVEFAMAALAGLGLQRLIDASTRAARRSAWLTIAIISLMAIDLLTFAWAVYRPVPLEEAFADGQAAAHWLADQGGTFRVYSPSYSIPQHVAQQYHLQLADGIDPLQLARYVHYMQRATGLGPWGYSVTLPPFPNIKSDDEIRTANANVIPDAALLGLLNVKYVVAAFPIDDRDLVERARFGTTIIYENQRVRPRAFVANTIDVAATPDDAARWLSTGNVTGAAVVEGLPWPIELPAQPHDAQIIDWQADHIAVKTSGPGLLVLSEIDAPDWIATIDGEPTAIYATDLTLRGVFVNWGEHTIELSYQPRRVSAGLLISGLSVAACAIALGIKRFGHGLRG